MKSLLQTIVFNEPTNRQRVAAATVYPKFLKFWSPPRDLVWFLIVWILEPFGCALILDGFLRIIFHLGFEKLLTLELL